MKSRDDSDHHITTRGDDMGKRLFLALALVLALSVGTSPSSRPMRAVADQTPNINVGLSQAMLDAMPPPQDDPMLDATGAPVLDATGKPVSDPAEGFHKVIPGVFDPAQTHLVQSTWLDGVGCPNRAKIADYPGTTQTRTETDTACQVADTKDTHNEGLLLVKTGFTNNNAAAVAELKKVRGITLTEIGYDIRKQNGAVGTQGSHCGAGAPRFDITTSEAFYFIGCTSPLADSQTFGTAAGDAWTRLRWGSTTGTPAVMGYCIITGPAPSLACPANYTLAPVSGTIQRIQIVFDEGTDNGGPDFFGAAFLDNIDVNGTLVGRGPAGPGMNEDQSHDDDDD
jgi:hypothetical protein